MVYHAIAYNFIVQDTYANQTCYDFSTNTLRLRHDSSGCI